MEFFKLNRLPIYGTAMTIIAGCLTACSQSKWHEVAPHTGDILAERQTAPTRPEDLRPRQPGYVVPDRLRGRSSPDQPPEDAPIILDRNEPVEVVDPTPKGNDGLISVRPVDPSRPANERPVVYVPPHYIDTRPVQPTREQSDADRYFMVQNIATETVRVYERCDSANCSHRLVFESTMMAGEESSRSLLGSFRIEKWFKFYEDNAGDYPSWYNPTYPALPPAGSSLEAWKSPSLLPNGRGVARGKFGWYTAHIGPNADAQWTHGTIGWGADANRFIETDDSGSRGCSRVENQAIAFLREILPVGTKIIKIYAKEAYRDSTRARYTEQPVAKFDWILTKEGVDIDGPKSGANGVLTRNVPADQILEKGTYTIDQMPDAVPLQRGQAGRRSGNLYGIQESSFQGYFLVDEGRLVNYRHPRGLAVGGHRDQHLPSIVIAHEGNRPAVQTASGKRQALRHTEGRTRVNGREVIMYQRQEQQ